MIAAFVETDPPVTGSGIGAGDGLAVVDGPDVGAAPAAAGLASPNTGAPTAAVVDGVVTAPGWLGVHADRTMRSVAASVNRRRVAVSPQTAFGRGSP
jgi:hypothetical protein